jgi:hypothetical protein
MTKENSKIALSAIARLRERLGQVPTCEAAEVSKQRAIGLLAPEFYAMHAKGYTWQAIASMLSDGGIQVTSIALQGYLREATREAAGRPKRAPKRSPPLAPAGAPVQSSPAAPPDKTSGAKQPEAPARGQVERRPAAPAEGVEAPAPTPARAPATPRRSAFVPRRNSDEI